jgi:hypothetical protein
MCIEAKSRKNTATGLVIYVEVKYANFSITDCRLNAYLVCLPAQAPLSIESKHNCSKIIDLNNLIIKREFLFAFWVMIGHCSTERTHLFKKY